MGDADGNNWDWGVGTFLKSKLPRSSAGYVNIDGMEFFIEPEQHPKISGKTLFYENGEFVVR